MILASCESAVMRSLRNSASPLVDHGGWANKQKRGATGEGIKRGASGASWSGSFARTAIPNVVFPNKIVFDKRCLINPDRKSSPKDITFREMLISISFATTPVMLP